MDDTQKTQQPTDQVVPSVDGMSSMSDVAGMTPPPPAPVMPDPMQAPIPSPMSDVASMPAADPMPVAQKPAGATTDGAESDYSYAEDVLNEILDSLDRVEAKLDAMEKKMG